MKFFYVVLKHVLCNMCGCTMAGQRLHGCCPVLDHEFRSSIGVALLDHEFGPSVEVGPFSELQNAFFGGSNFTSPILDR